VPYYLCRDDGEINTDGAMLIDERFDGPRDVPTDSCPSLETCCAKNEEIIESPEIKAICSEQSAPAKCGFRNPKGLGGMITR
jgi:Serine protease Clip domain PPAF-2